MDNFQAKLCVAGKEVNNDVLDGLDDDEGDTGNQLCMKLRLAHLSLASA